MVIFIWIISGIICAVIANNKGRNVIGWFFIGFFLSIIGIVIALVVSDLKEAKAKEEYMEIEQRRLREQLHQERIKSEKMRQYTQMRLDIHDRELQIDTRNIGHLLDSNNEKELFGDTNDFPKKENPGQIDDFNMEH